MMSTIHVAAALYALLLASLLVRLYRAWAGMKAQRDGAAKRAAEIVDSVTKARSKARHQRLVRYVIQVGPTQDLASQVLRVLNGMEAKTQRRIEESVGRELRRIRECGAGAR